ncbi:MAG TPA: glycosyl hydrolase family 18 protein [Xanthomonadales bacterium]|nr:glycosyl hydrolase family 18 protein [Xanthomonadales bacterium]
MKKITGFILVLIILITASWFYFARTYPLTSPLKSSVYFMQHIIKPHAKMQKETIGFLPYWRLDDIQHIRLDLITEVNYFGLFVNGEGEFVTVVNGETNPGKREWESEKVKDLITKTQIMGAKFTLTIVCQDNDDIESILDSETAQKNLITNILSEVKSRDLDGINIDFEYLGTPDEKYKQKFTDFSKRLKQELKKHNPDVRLAVSIMPRSARIPDIFDFAKIVPIYDYFIGMSYDFYGSYPEIAGPIAPMTGFNENKFFFDTTTMYEDLGKHIPKEKILMGVPHYGWDWSVTDGKKIQSATLPQDDPDSYAAVISYARARENKDLKKSQCKFDDYAKEPWCWYTDKKGIDHQVWYEDTKSIGIKYDFANEQNFGGIAIWVLGYDKDYPDLWNMMKDKFTSP